MSELAVFQAELDRLEREDRWDAPEYDYLAAKVEELKAAEKSKPSAQRSTSADQPESDPVAALVRDMERAAANPDRLSVAERDGLVDRFNAAVLATAQTDQPERVDVAALAREMTAAGADPNLDAEQARELARRYDVAVRQDGQRTTSELRAELSSADLPTRMLAAGALLERRELSDDEASAVADAYNAAVHETSAAFEAAGGIDVAALPTELRPAAEALMAAKKSLETPPDPVDAALHQFNQAVRKMRTPSLEQQLVELGLDPDPELGGQAEREPAQVSTGEGRG